MHSGHCVFEKSFEHAKSDEIFLIHLHYNEFLTSFGHSSLPVLWYKYLPVSNFLCLFDLSEALIALRTKFNED